MKNLIFVVAYNILHLWSAFARVGLSKDILRVEINYCLVFF